MPPCFLCTPGVAAPRRVPAHFLPRAITTLLSGAILAPALALAEETQRLSPIVVTAGGFEQDIEQAPASITVITREELETRAVTNLADALRGIEGANVRSLDARSGKTGNQTISLRGLPSEYTLILIDGVRQNVSGTVAPNAFTDSASVFIPPVAAIDRIEVIRGPMATLYGSDAIGGVVNIITRHPSTDRWEGTVALDSTFQSDSDFGNYTTLEGYASGPLVNERLALQVYGRLFDRAASSIDIPGTTPSLTDNRTMGQNPVDADVGTFGGWETVYHITVTPMPAGKGETWVTVDGVARDDAAIPLVDDRREHAVEVRVSNGVASAMLGHNQQVAKAQDLT